MISAKQIRKLYADSFGQRDFLISFGLAIFILVSSLVINFHAGMYAIEKASNSVTDIILNNIRVYDVDLIFVYGPLVLWIFVGAVLFFQPRRLPLTFKSIGLFVLIRSLFITLTHIGPFPTHAAIPLTGVLGDFTSGGDLFFSGHTGLPFLLALIFWDRLPLRIIFLASSVLFGVIVLLGHLHYSIDVLSAFFITYTIYHLAVVIFPADAARANIG